MSEEPKSQEHGWFHTLPGILTAVAATLTAVTGLVVALKPADVSPPATQTLSSPQATSSPVIATPHPQSSPVQATADTPEEEKVRYKRKKRAKDE